MIAFDIEHGNLTVNAETLLISAFSDIWEFDKSRRKEKAIKMLKFVFYIADITQKNPFNDSHHDQKEELAKRDAFRDAKYKFTKKEDDLIKTAIAWYEELNFNPLSRMLDQINKDIDSITYQLSQTTITTDNMSSRIKLMGEINKMVESKEKLEDAVKRSLAKAKVRGDMSSSPAEKGLLKLNGSKKNK